MIKNTKLSTYEKLKICLSEIRPDISLELIEADYMLKELGFVDDPPCTIQIDITDEQIEEIMDFATELEIDAYYDNPYDKEAQVKYKRYGWLYAFFDTIYLED